MSFSTVLKFVINADDSTLFLPYKSLVDLFSDSNNELSRVYNWFLDNRLSLNVTKTTY